MSAKRKALATVARPVQKIAAALPPKSRVDESKTFVSAAAANPAGNPIEISSNSESDYDDISDLDEDEEEGSRPQLTASSAIDSTPPDATSRLKRARDSDTAMPSPPHTKDEGQDAAASDDGEIDGEPTSPTFGDLIRGHDEPIDVNTALAARQEPTPNSLLQPHPRTVALPSLSSLGTVLNQALRTDDAELLESCLQTRNTHVIHNTVQRMDSTLAGVLLTKLAARMHRRPGRAHTLMTWVKTALVAHGGALATQPAVVKRLAELNRVLEERARGLNSLLVLKGKLDMLEAQMELRRSNKGRGRNANTADDSDDEEAGVEEGIIYVEGEEDDALANGTSTARKTEKDDDEFPVTNGVADSDDSDDDEGDMDVDQPDLTDAESLDEDDVDHEDVDEESGEEDDSDVETAAPPTKLQKTSKAFTKRR